MPRQGQLHIRAPSSHALPFLVWNIGGVCNTPLPYRPTEATSIHSPPLGTILWAPRGHTLPFLVWNIEGVCFCTLPYRPTGATSIHSLPSGTILWADDPTVSPRVGAYCIRPTQCPVRGNSIQERLADTRCRFLFGSFGGVCNTPLPYRPTGATAIHSLPSENIS